MTAELAEKLGRAHRLANTWDEIGRARKLIKEDSYAYYPDDPARAALDPVVAALEAAMVALRELQGAAVDDFRAAQAAEGVTV